ncbi:MAG TPA: FliH/SctL family protein [Bacillota bacterium]
MSRLIKTAAAAAPAPAQRLWQEFEVARSRPPGAVRVADPGDAAGAAQAGAAQAGAAQAAAQAAAAAAAPLPPEDEAPAGGQGAPRPAAGAETLRRRLEAERRSGYEAGRTEGAREALAAAEEAIRAEVSALRAELEAFIEEERAYRQRAERSLVELAMTVAERVVRDAVASGPDALLPLVAEVAGRIGDEGVRVRAHAREAAALKEAAQGGGPLAGLTVDVDPALQPGDVILESPRGRYDLRPATLLDRVRRRLEGEVGPA